MIVHPPNAMKPPATCTNPVDQQ